MIHKLYKVNQDGTFGGEMESYSETNINLSDCTPPIGCTFLAPPDSIPETHQAVFDGISWNIEAKPSPTPEPTLEDIKEAKCIAIRDESDRLITLMQSRYSQGEVKTFEQQHQGSVDILEGNEQSQTAQFVIALLTGRLGSAPTADEKISFATLICTNYEGAAISTATIVGKQQNLEIRIRSCTTVEEVETEPVWEE